MVTARTGIVALPIFSIPVLTELEILFWGNIFNKDNNRKGRRSLIICVESDGGSRGMLEQADEVMRNFQFLT